MNVIPNENSTAFIISTNLHLQFYFQLLIKIRHANYEMYIHFKP